MLAINHDGEFALSWCQTEPLTPISPCGKFLELQRGVDSFYMNSVVKERNIFWSHKRSNFTKVNCSARFCVGGLSEDWRGALSHNPGAIFICCFSVCEANPILSTNRDNFKGTTSHSWSYSLFCDAWLDGPLTRTIYLAHTWIDVVI